VSLRALLGDVADGLGDVEVATGPGDEVTWSVVGRPFAALSADGLGAEFALDTAVAAAATRTPDVVPSQRGPGWVLFRPIVVDDHAANRAEAWFASAHRRLTPG
jgi:hypothetical protein